VTAWRQVAKLDLKGNFVTYPDCLNSPGVTVQSVRLAQDNRTGLPIKQVPTLSLSLLT